MCIQAEELGAPLAQCTLLRFMAELSRNPKLQKILYKLVIYCRSIKKLVVSYTTMALYLQEERDTTRSELARSSRYVLSSAEENRVCN
jgi:hypothetical protein